LSPVKGPSPDLPAQLDRRRFLWAASLAPLASCVSSKATPSQPAPASQSPEAPVPLAPTVDPTESVVVAPEGSDLATPDFTRVQRFVAGIRPYRRGCYRLEASAFGENWVVHNYGHGGAGLSVAWGCAVEAVALLEARVAPRSEVAVLGAGVLGLSTASVLLARGFQPVVYAAAFTPETTSDVAGGQWSPSLIAVSSAERERFQRIQRTSIEHYRAHVGREFGIHVRDNYVEAGRGSSVLDISRAILPPTRELERLPFRGVDRPGRVRETLLIEPPVYLPRLHEGLAAAGVAFVQRRFESVDEVLDLPHSAFVNCLGAGAGSVMSDDRAVPVRGQLVMLEPQDLPWLLSHRNGYIFPRTDGVVLGGTVEHRQADPTPDPGRCEQILARNAAFFQV